MLTREEVRQDTIPDAPSVPWAPVGASYRILVTGSTKVTERDRETQALLTSKSVVVTGVLQAPADGWTKKGPVHFEPGQLVNLWFNSGARTGALIKALDEAQSNLYDGGILVATVVEERPPTKPGNDGLKILGCSYTPPPPGMARNDIANGAPAQPQYAQPAQPNGYPQPQQYPPQQPMQQPVQPYYPQQQPAQPQYPQQPAQPQYAQPQQPQYEPAPQQPQYQQPAQPQQYPQQPQYPQQAAPQQYEPQAAPQQPQGPPAGAATLDGMMGQQAAAYQAPQQPQG